MNIAELIEKHAKIIGCPENDGPPSQAWVDAGVKDFAVELLEMVKRDAAEMRSRICHDDDFHEEAIDNALEELKQI